MREQDAAAHRRSVQHAISDDKTNGKEEIGSRQEGDGGPASTYENGGKTGTCSEHTLEKTICNYHERDEERKSDEVSAVRERLDQRDGIVAPVTQERVRDQEHEDVDWDEV